MTIDATQPIGSILPYFGAKRTLAPTIVAALGEHSVYWEPFCGSMAVLLAKSPVKSEVLNDLNADIVNLGRVISHPKHGPAFYRRLRRVWLSQNLFADARKAVIAGSADTDVVDPDRAYDYFVMSWMGMNGVAGTSITNTNFCRRFSSTGGDPGVRWQGVVRSIPQWRRRLERVQILRSNGIELCEHIEDAPGVALYCDPPYFAKGAKYLHDFTSDDHERLAKVLRRFRLTRVILSYYDHPRLAELYPAWHRRDVAVTKTMVNSGKRDKSVTKAQEVLLSNLPILLGGSNQQDLFG